MLIHTSTPSKTNKAFLFFLFLLFTLAAILFHKEIAEALCVKDKKAHLRSGPGKHNEKLWTVLKYFPLKQLGREGRWLRVKDLDGDFYWIYQTITTKAYMCAVIKNNKTNLRHGSRAQFPSSRMEPSKKIFFNEGIKNKRLLGSYRRQHRRSGLGSSLSCLDSIAILLFADLRPLI